MKSQRENKVSNVRSIATTLAVAGLLACGTASAVQRVFVSSTGSDTNTANNCTFSNPCRGFTAAMTVVDDGGEVVALDAAGYGVVTISKGVTIVANPGFYAGITAGSGNAITINAPGKNVLLRGLNINGIGGVTGVNMVAGNSLTIDGCVIGNFSGSGVLVNSSTASVKVSNTVMSSNGGDGLQVAQGKVDVVGSRANGNVRGGFTVETTGAGNTATLTVTDSTASGNQHGFFANANAASSTVQMSLTRAAGTTNTANGMFVQQLSGSATGVVGNSTFTENVNGLNNGGGTLRSLGNNVVDFNTNNTTGTISVLGGL
jgi:hypothetical protein